MPSTWRASIAISSGLKVWIGWFCLQQEAGIPELFDQQGKLMRFAQSLVFDVADDVR